MWQLEPVLEPMLEPVLEPMLEPVLEPMLEPVLGPMWVRWCFCSASARANTCRQVAQLCSSSGSGTSLPG
jgi:hypothetical protein